MGKILAIVAHKLETIKMQGQQDSFNSSPRNESINPEICTDPKSWNGPIRTLVKREPESEDNFNSSSNYDLIGPENHPIGIMEELKLH